MSQSILRELIVRYKGDLSPLAESMSQVGSKATAALGPVGIALGVVGAAVGSLAVLSVKASNEIADAYREIEVRSGAVGTGLQSLRADFAAVFGTVDDDARSVAEAIGSIHARTGLVGEGLQELSKQILDLSDITGTDLTANIAAATRLFGDWSIASEKQSGALDLVFRASQQTGIGVTRLMELVVQFGAPLRAFGFGFEEAAALMGKWEKEGVNLETVLSGLRFALGNFAKAHKEPTEALKQVIEQIKAAKSESAATAIAFENFGKRAATDMGRAIIEGRFNIEDLVRSLKDGKNTILETADANETFAESIAKMGNKVTLILEPLGKEIVTTLKGALAELGGFIDENHEAIVAALNGIIARFQDLGDILGPVLKSVGNIVTGEWDLALDNLIEATSVSLDKLIDLFLSASRKIATTIRTNLDDMWEGYKQMFNAIDDAQFEAGKRRFLFGEGRPVTVPIKIKFEGDQVSRHDWSKVLDLDGQRKVLDDILGYTDDVLGPDGKTNRTIAAGGSKMRGTVKKVLDDVFALVSEWQRSLSQKMDLSKAVFEKLPEAVKASLGAQAAEWRANENAIQRWQAILSVNLAKAGFEVGRVGDEIVVSSAAIRKSFADLGGEIEGSTVVTERWADDFAASMVEVASAVQTENSRIVAANRETRDALVATFEDLSHQIPDSFNLIVDSIVNKSGLLGDALLNVAIEVKGYVKDALDVIDTMPGKLGDSLRAGTRSIEQWIKFLDSSIKLIQRVFGEAQTGLAGVIESIVGAFKGMSKSAGESSEGLGGILGKIGGLFKKTGGEALSSVDKLKSAGGVFAEFGDEISKSSEETGGTVSKAFAMMTTAITAFASGASIAAATGSKAIGALGGAAMGALQGFASGGPVGAIVGGIAGLFGGLFGGGKSPLQKAQEAAELQKARDAVRQSQEAVLQAVEKTKQDWIATLDKARELLESIQFYTKVPKLSFKEFFADVGKLFANILVLAKQFAGLATADVKAVVKALKPAVEAVAELPEALNAINSHLKVPDIQFDKFFADAEALLERLGELYDEIPKKIRKHARKFQEQLGDALQVIPDLAGALAGIFDVRELSDAQLDVMKRSLEKLVQRLGEVAQSFEKSLVKLIGFFAEKIGPAISLLKEHVELVRSMVDLPMPSESDFANLFESLVKGLNMAIASALSVTEESLSFAVAVWNKAREVFEAVKSGIEVVKAIAEAKWPEATAWDAFLASIQTMLNTLTAGLASMLEARDVAAQIADAAREIADSVGAATSAMASTASAAAAGAGVVPASVTIPGIQSFASRALSSAGPAFSAPQGAAQYGDVTISVVQEGPTEGDLSSWERFKEYNKRFWRDLRGRAQMLGRDDLVPVFLTDF